MKRRRLPALILGLLFLVAACNAEDEAFVGDFIKDILLSNPMGTASGFLGADSGDPLIDLVTKGGDVMNEQDKRDKAFEDALRTGDQTTMDKLIKQFPRDYGYRVQRGTWALEHGQVSTYIDDSKSAQSTAAANGHTLSEAQQELDRLRSVEGVLTVVPGGVAGFSSKFQCQTLYDNLLSTQARIKQAGGTTTSEDQANWMRARQGCDSLP
jgi:hypothetical protein